MSYFSLCTLPKINCLCIYLSNIWRILRTSLPKTAALIPSPFFSLLHFLFPFYVPTRGREKNREMHLAVSRINISGHLGLSPKKEKKRKENNGGGGGAPPLHIGKFSPLPSVYCGCFSCKKKLFLVFFRGNGGARIRKGKKCRAKRRSLSSFCFWLKRSSASKESVPLLCFGETNSPIIFT